MKRYRCAIAAAFLMCALLQVSGCESASETFSESYPPKEQDAGNEDADAGIEDADAGVCRIDQNLEMLYDGRWICNICRCDKQVCNHEDTKTGEKWHGTCDANMKCSEQCPSPLWEEWEDSQDGGA